MTWNRDKPHRCPECHAIAVATERPKGGRIYRCCTCGQRFAKWPGLPFQKQMPILCGDPEHADRWTVRERPTWR